MPGQKTEPLKKPRDITHVVIITNPSLTQVVCGGFVGKAAARKYAKSIAKRTGLIAVPAPITPTKVVEDYINANHN